MQRGSRIDNKYQLEALLGEGAMGSVYRAVQLSLDRTVAVKLLRRDAVSSPEAVDRLKREALAVARLRHPNIISVIDFGVSEAFGAYLVLEYLEGRSLRDELDAVEQMPAEEAVALLLPACQALGAAHDAGVVHRDLKPANLFVVDSPPGRALKVLDFGIATLQGTPAGEDATTLGGPIVGTPLYMSPEQCDGGPVDARSDVYALGCILYEMIAGRPPFVAETVAEILMRQRTYELRRPSFLASGVPSWLDDVLLRALAKSPADRFATANELAAALATEGGRSPVTDEQGRPEIDAPRSNLPPETTAFVGRERDIADIASRLAEARLVTLTGPGGIGKTRLARETARAVADRFPDGVWLVELAGLLSPDLVASAVAQVLGVREEAGRPLVASLEEAVEPKRLLVILDNCEHLVEACAELTAALLGASAGTRVLATSREVFGLDGEAVWIVPALPVPDGEPTADEAARHAAVRLFVDRARLSRAAFALTDGNAGAVATLCRALDGLPLAIELAAARAATVPLPDLVVRMGDRFRVLDGGGRGALPRHRTLRAALDWSYDLLTDDERTLLTRLSIFAGGFSLEATEEVCAGAPVDELAVFDILRRLVDKSLVTADEQPGGVRFRLLETVRAYAREKLFVSGEETRLLAAHSAWCVALAERALAESDGPRRAEWNVKLETEHDNLRAALRRALDTRDAATALRIATGLNRFWGTYGFLSEGRQWIEAALAVAGSEHSALRAAALTGLARLELIQADHHGGIKAIDEALDLRRALGDGAGLAVSLGIKSLIVGRLGNYDLAYEIQEESLALNRELGLTNEANESVFYMGLLAMYRGDFDVADAHFVESLATYRAANNRHKVVVLLHNIGEVAWFRHEPREAAAYLEECLKLTDGPGSRRLVADTRRSLARAAGDLGELERARALFAESLALQREIGNREGVIEVVEGSACVAAKTGDARRAVALAAAAGRARAELDIPPDSGFQAELDRRVAAAAAQLTSDEVEAARAEGRALSLDDATVYALQKRSHG